MDDLQLHEVLNPPGASLAFLVNQDIPLNRKQRMVVEKVLSEALTWADHPYDWSRRNQTLLYVGGEGGTGKSQIVKAIVAGMKLIGRKDEVVLMALTGAASLLSAAILRRLWFRKTIMIVDEVSMMDLRMISVIDNQCKIVKALDRSSPDLFGGLPVVIFIEVIILDEQMRHAEEDTAFRDLLSRARAGTLTETDRSFLNSKTVTTLVSPQLEGVTTVVKLNSPRHQVNRVRLTEFARTRWQNIYIFPAPHKRTKSTASTNLRLHADDLLQQPDQGTKIPFPGLFLYTRNMPAVILTNICTPLGLVNGATGIAIGIVVDPTAEFFQIDNLYIMCTKPPSCVIFGTNRSKATVFQGLEPSAMPIFPLERSITIKGYSVRRKQLPMCPASCLTDYKVQGSTLSAAILDLKDDPTIRGQDHHRKYCSTNSICTTSNSDPILDC
ncbi:hypothetical protein IFM58399_00725 [Aspergillus lentulus]|uniref:uncharacterized protein n=1 Tax=Aspergillus lentulus TaxID=293939 RepID=UPI001393682F|nr:uncharacterized protein IFM58399_00725 [Aspergillus lentulus]GFF24605.1 hypothetical protein IFM58399_00725 [Aspergillus lentulus]GFF60493.1 hypothetical protein IFM62136_04636 [Aspergillus lentulus]GFF82838.1 hypothetical protein IFM47457_05934 [Aspergillus lentulus]